MKILKSIDSVIRGVEKWFIVLLLGTMIVLTFFHVMLRGLYTHAHFQWANEFLGHIDWTEPLVRLLLLWITFLGASLITGENRHIKIDLMQSLTPSSWLPVREILISVGCMLVCGLMLKASIEYITMEMDFGSYLFLEIPAWICQLILPAGFAVILFRFFLRGLEQFFRLARRVS